MKKKTKIAALTIVYHPQQENLEAIKTYVNDVDKLYVFDNSEDTNIQIKNEIEKLENTEYITRNENLGLPIPINLIAQKAREEGYEWLITFDHDSKASEGMITNMRKFSEEFENIEQVGIISPIVNDKKLKFSLPPSEYSYYDKVIQSGAMHNLAIMEKIGGYDEKMFIDQVDYEYCMRVMINGFKIIKLNTAVLIHNIEDVNSKVMTVEGKRIVKNKYSILRYYYIVRNNLYCCRKYKKSYPPYYAEGKRNIEVIKKTVLFDGNRKQKRKAIFLAYLDFYTGKMGKCRWIFK